ncbi:protein kinase, putative [Trypanosoma cruzi]|uniref:mitogen-activated protein kinase kinase n=1 Tax=Trypanosoma cruzi (strain CL Brener) TaxID=353153 RepID=Q4E0A0_TRYCC|nr:protein kinase, putative [Trypanosoma cruzi]EAN98177.1 protein kinase, putative [Trypanosoma cruzi]|eukprot:XP_820028.1 protein kinase [Trypanosoma cruzi strain CL Brener]
MAGLKINLDDLESDNDDSAQISHEVLRLGELTVSAEGLTTSMGYKYGLSPDDVIVSETGFLGQGSSGSVRRATHRRTGEVLALKEIKITSHAHLQEIRRELETLHRDGNNSPNLVDFYGAFCHEGSVFIAMECMDGSLATVKKPVPIEALASISRSILLGLWDLHGNRHLIHRDLKPSNILFSRDGRIKISDFGVSSFLECTRGDAHSFVGTLTHMSPERLKGESYSFAADVWSFGLVVAELALGRCPFIDKLTRSKSSTEAGFWVLLQHLNSDRPVITLPQTMDPSLADFISMCIQKDPQSRPTCKELLRHSFIIKGSECDDKHVIREWLLAMPMQAEPSPSTGECGQSLVPPAGPSASLNLDDELSRLVR